MFEETHFMKTQYMLEKGLQASMVKRKVFADNIANVDVPHFKRSDVVFEEMLRRAVNSEKFEKLNTVPTKITHEKHMEFFKPLDYKKVNPKINIDYLTTMRADGNNVDIEKEATLASQNQMLYTIMVERLNQNNRELNMVMRLA